MTVLATPRGDGSYENTVVLYHRLKFCLHHGYLPAEVDHADTDRTNSRLSNLRAATRSQQGQNKNKTKGRMPRGVYASKSGNRFKAAIQYLGQKHFLGSFATREEASEAVEKQLKDLHGEFYREV